MTKNEKVYSGRHQEDVDDDQEVVDGHGDGPLYNVKLLFFVTKAGTHPSGTPHG
jgi:hypothetical protein